MTVSTNCFFFFYQIIFFSFTIVAEVEVVSGAESCDCDIFSKSFVEVAVRDKCDTWRHEELEDNVSVSFKSWEYKTPSGQVIRWRLTSLHFRTWVQRYNTHRSTPFSPPAALHCAPRSYLFCLRPTGSVESLLTFPSPLYARLLSTGDFIVITLKHNKPIIFTDGVLIKNGRETIYITSLRQKCDRRFLHLSVDVNANTEK